MKKLLTLLTLLTFLLAPAIADASLAAPWNATSTDAGFISPNLINGNYPFLKIPSLVATSTTIASIFNANVGIGTTSPFAPLSVVGRIYQNGDYSHFGTAQSNNPCITLSASCLEEVGSDNTFLGVNLDIENTNPGNLAYSGLNLFNDLKSTATTNYAGLYENSSIYNDPSNTFGSLNNVPNLVQLGNSMGPLSIQSFASTSAASYVNFYAASTTPGFGPSAAGEGMRLTSMGLGIGTSTFSQATSTVESGASQTNTFLTGSNNGFLQEFLQNRSNGTNASTDLVIGNDKSSPTGNYYLDLNMDSSGYAQPAFSSENAGDGALVASDGALVLGTASSTNPLADIRLETQGTASSSIRLDINANGNVGVGTTTPYALLSVGNTGGIGFTLATSTWNTTGGVNINSGCYAVRGVCLATGGAGSGTVTSVATDATLTGGTITTTGTLGLNLTNPNTWTGTQTFNATPNSFITGTGNAGIGTTTPTGLLSIDTPTGSIPQVGTLFSIASTTAGGVGKITELSLTDTGAGSVALNLNSASTVAAINAVGGSLQINTAGSTRINVQGSATTFSVASGGNTGSVANGHFIFNGITDVTMPGFLSDYPIFVANFGQVRSRGSSPLATINDFRITPSIENYTAGSTTIANNTIASSTTFFINGTPTPGVNANITSVYDLFLGATSTLTSASTTNSYGLAVQANAGAVNNFAAEFLGGVTQFFGGLGFKRTATATSYTVATSTDYLIGVTSTASARTITLPSCSSTGATTDGFHYQVKDESGAAATNNVTIQPVSSQTIDGASTKVINTNYGYLSMYCVGASNAWFVSDM